MPTATLLDLSARAVDGRASFVGNLSCNHAAIRMMNVAAIGMFTGVFRRAFSDGVEVKVFDCPIRVRKICIVFNT